MARISSACPREAFVFGQWLAAGWARLSKTLSNAAPPAGGRGYAPRRLRRPIFEHAAPPRSQQPSPRQLARPSAKRRLDRPDGSDEPRSQNTAQRRHRSFRRHEHRASRARRQSPLPGIRRRHPRQRPPPAQGRRGHPRHDVAADTVRRPHATSALGHATSQRRLGLLRRGCGQPQCFVRDRRGHRRGSRSHGPRASDATGHDQSLLGSHDPMR